MLVGSVENGVPCCQTILPGFAFQSSHSRQAQRIVLQHCRAQQVLESAAYHGLAAEVAQKAMSGMPMRVQEHSTTKRCGAVCYIHRLHPGDSWTAQVAVAYSSAP